MIKLFLGSPLTSEVRMHLAESRVWKERSLQSREGRLEQLRHDGRDYLGCFLEGATVDLEQLRTHQVLVYTALREGCPDVDFDKAPLYLIPQLFLC